MGWKIPLDWKIMGKSHLFFMEEREAYSELSLHRGPSPLGLLQALGLAPKTLKGPSPTQNGSLIWNSIEGKCVR
jgi:hypothetical protein